MAEVAESRLRNLDLLHIIIQRFSLTARGAIQLAYGKWSCVFGGAISSFWLDCTRTDTEHCGKDAKASEYSVRGLSWKVSFVSKKLRAFDEFLGYHKIEIRYDSVPEVERLNKRPRLDSALYLQPLMNKTDLSSSAVIARPNPFGGSSVYRR